MMFNKRILQFTGPEPGEPICSGSELTLEQGRRIDLCHFRAVISVTAGKRNLLLGGASGITLDCVLRIGGREFEAQKFTVTHEDIGKTLFCAGFPCLTVTGIDGGKGGLVITMSEIVEAGAGTDGETGGF